MRKSIFIILFALLGVLSARAYDFMFDGIYYNYIFGTDQVKVTSGVYKDYSGSVVIPSTITYYGYTYAVTSIGSSAFSHCEGLTSVTIPESVDTIGNYAFFECTGLTSVTIPESVDYIGDEAFYGCTSISTPLYNSKIFAYLPQNYSGAYAIPSGIQSIAGSAFRDCSSLTSVTIPESVTEIGYMAFYGCTSISIPLYNSKIFAYLPRNYKGEYTIPSGIQSIANNAFRDCGSLTSVTIPESVTEIESLAFYGCPSISSPLYNSKVFAYMPRGYRGEYVIPSGIQSIACDAFEYCSGLTSVTIPESVTTIGSSAFRGCTGLASVSIPESVTTIGFSAFGECTGLTSVTLPESVTTIWSHTFWKCTGLMSVTIPSSVTAIDEFTFWGCSNLMSVTSLTTTPPRIGYYYDGEFYATTEPVFSVYSATLYVPRGCKAAYESAQEWKEFSKIEELSTATVTVLLNDDAMGRVTGNGNHETGKEITMEAIPNPGYHFVKWSDNETANPRTLTVTKDITLTAEFAPDNYMVNVSVAGEGGGTVSGGDTYAFGAEATLMAIPNAGYHFVQWSDENADNPRTLTVTKDTTLMAEFTPNIYTVTAQPYNSTGGMVSGGRDYAFGSSATLEAVPNPGYHFVKWNDENTDNPRMLTVTRDTAFTAVFAINTFIVGVYSNNETWGSVSPSGDGTYASASSVTITATPNEGYRFIKWTKGEEVFSTHADTTFKVVENLVLVANFEQILEEPVEPEDPEEETFTLQVSANNSVWGNVSQSGNGTYKKDSLASIIATPAEGYRFVNWMCAGLSAAFCTRADTTFVVTENLTIIAHFEKIPEEPEPPVEEGFKVILTPNNPAWGMVFKTGNCTYGEGEEITILALPFVGYHFVNWTKGGAVFATDSLITFKVTENLELTANFEKIPDEPEPIAPVVDTFTISVSANNEAWGNVSQSGDGTYEKDSSVTITATPNEGYLFVNWTKDGAVFATASDTTFSVTEDLELTANFEKRPDDAETFTVSLSVNNPDWGIVSQLGDGTYEKDGSATIIAAPKTGYRFVNWTKKDDAEFSTEAVYVFVVTESLELTANFEKQPDVANESGENDNFRVYVQDRTIYLSEGRGLVQVYNVAGQCVYNGISTAIPVRQGGLYIVNVGGRRYKVLVR